LMLGPWRGVGAVGQWGSRMLGGHWRGVLRGRKTGVETHNGESESGWQRGPNRKIFGNKKRS